VEVVTVADAGADELSFFMVVWEVALGILEGRFESGDLPAGDGFALTLTMLELDGRPLGLPRGLSIKSEANLSL